jgi:MFS family permease
MAEGASGRNGPPRPSIRQALGSLSEPVFRRWFLSQVLSASGTMTQGVALSWLVLRLTGSGLDLGLVSSFTFLPLLCLGPFAGSLVDRFDRRRLLLCTQSALLALAVLLAILTATGREQLWMLYVIAAATGTVAAPDSAARQVYVLELVGRGRVASAVGLNEVVINASRVLGPAAGGTLLATVGVSACCLLNAASYIPPLLVLSSAVPRQVATRPPGESGQHKTDWRTGLDYAWRNKTIRVSVILAAASGMLFGLSVPLPLLATKVFHLGGGGYGLMMAVFGIGALPGAVLAGASPKPPTGRECALLALGTGSSIIFTALAPSLVLVMIGLGVTGGVSIWFIARTNTLVQLLAEPRMRGRVMGVWSMALPGFGPVTSPVVGYVGESLGPREGFGLAGIALLTTASLGWRTLVGRASAPVPEDGSPREEEGASTVAAS